MTLDVRRTLADQPLKLEIIVGDRLGRLKLRHGDRDGNVVEELLKTVAFKRIGKTLRGEQLLDLLRVRLLGKK